MNSTNSSIHASRYIPSLRDSWNALVNEAANSALIHHRDYMDYHQDRFEDHSIVFISEGKLIAALPASQLGNQLISHAGLTFGGLIYSYQVDSAQQKHCLALLKEYIALLVFNSFILKDIPPFFTTGLPNPAIPIDNWAEFGFNSKEDKTFYAVPLPMNVKDRGKRWGAEKAKKNGVSISQSFNWEQFWDEVLIPNLQDRHQASPVHSLDEITRLAGRLPINIQLWTASQDSEILSGCVIFVWKEVVHCQYISSTPRGRKLRGLDLLFTELFTVFREFRYFSLGTAIHPATQLPDPGLVQWKKSWGAKPFPTATWSWNKE